MRRIRQAGRGSQRDLPAYPHHRPTPGTLQLRLDVASHAGAGRVGGRGAARINPHDAEPLNIHENQMVEVASRRGVLTVRAHLSNLCSPGVVFLSFHFDEVPTNILVGNYLDPLACTPSYKVSAVRVTPAVAAE